MNNLDVVAVGIKHPGRIIARIVFRTRLWWLLALSTGG
jgi:hypothetical protein